MTVRRLPGLALPSSLSADQRAFFQAVIEHLQVNAGDRGAPLDRALTPRDLVDAGLATAVVKAGRALLRGKATEQSSSTTATAFSAASWDVVNGALAPGSDIEILALSNDTTYLRIPTEYLAAVLGLVDTESAQSISAPWIFDDTVDIEGDALRFDGEQVITLPGYGLGKVGSVVYALHSGLTPAKHAHIPSDISEFIITPTQITATTNDFSAPGIELASIVRMSTDASRDVTGMVPGIRRTIINVGAFDLVIRNSDAGSVAANRFLLTADITIPPNGSASFWYDTVDTRWRKI